MFYINNLQPFQTCVQKNIQWPCQIFGKPAHQDLCVSLNFSTQSFGSVLTKDCLFPFNLKDKSRNPWHIDKKNTNLWQFKSLNLRNYEMFQKFHGI